MAVQQYLKDRLAQAKQTFSKMSQAVGKTAYSAMQNPTLKNVASFGERSSNVIFRPYKEVASDVKDYVQSTARTFVGAGLSLKDKEEFVPQSVPSKILLGPQPVKRFEEQTLQRQKQFEALGISPKIAPFVAFGVGALDLASPFPFGPEDFAKAGLKGLAKSEVEALAKELGPKVAQQIAEGKASKEAVRSARDFIKSSRAANTPATPRESYSPSLDINKEKLNLTTGQKQVIDNVVESIKPELEAIYNRPITLEEVEQAAKHSSVLKQVYSREQTLEDAGAVRRTSQNLVNYAKAVADAKTNPVGVTEAYQKLIDSIKVVKSLARRDAVMLGARRGVADDLPENIKIVDEILDKLSLTEKQLDDILAEAVKIDVHDIGQLTDFYRKYIKPTGMDVLNEYRYINLLSNPRTHTTNMLSNLLQVGVRGADKLASGAVDKVIAGFTGKARDAYIREVPEYIKGSFNSIPAAWKEAKNVFQGGIVERPDLIRIPTGKIPKVLTSVTRALEASDIFFRKIISSGEYESLVYRAMKSKGTTDIPEVDLAMLRKQAEDTATEYVFRGELGKSDEGKLFKFLDSVANKIKEIGSEHGSVRWLVPFVDTPTNILKQGIERTPGIGLAALPGSSRKMETISRQLVGSTLFTGTMYMAMQDKTTWATPTGKTESAKFFAEGKQPYSVKIGDKWVSYDRLGPLAYPMAFAAAIKHTFVDEQEKLVEQGKDPKGAGENVTKAMLKMTKFFGDQSYVENIGNLMDVVLEGDVNKAERIAANIPAQLIPLEQFVAMMTRMIDDAYRKPDNIMEHLMSQIPGLSFSVAPYEDPFGEASRRQNRFFNLLSPVSITQEKDILEPKSGVLPKPKVTIVPKPTVKVVK